MNCHGQSHFLLPYGHAWPLQIPLILENITARIIFWHSNVIASNNMQLFPLSCWFRYLTSSCAINKRHILRFSLCSPHSLSQPCSCWTDHTGNNSWAWCKRNGVMRDWKCYGLSKAPHPSMNTTITISLLLLSPLFPPGSVSPALSQYAQWNGDNSHGGHAPTNTQFVPTASYELWAQLR